MTGEALAAELAEIAVQQLARTRSQLPSDTLQRHALFTECVRAVDYWAVFQRLLPQEHRMAHPDIQLIQWGWNVAVGHLLEPLSQGGFPLMESTKDSQSFALNLLHQFGRFVLVHRTCEMIRHGFVAAEKSDRGYVVRTIAGDAAQQQHLDVVEFTRLTRLEKSVWGDREGWTRKWMRRDIEDLMAPLITPWDTGRGVMVNYGALPEVDDHFNAIALQLAREWSEEAGIHPETRFGELTGADLIGIGTIVIGFHAKHVGFTMLAARKHPHISLPQSLTIWGEREKMAQAIAEVTEEDPVVVRNTIAMLSLRPSDMPRLREHTTPFRPLLIDLGNGLVVRPVSCLDANAFNAVRTLVEWRIPEAKGAISAPREEWARTDLYGLFQGNRYECVEGAIKIRESGRVSTDIDGAVLDRVSGDLALFQFKWQDMSTNDVRSLRSKASNFAREMDDWTTKVNDWVGRVGIEAVMKTLRLQPRNHRGRVHLFGVSRIGARLQAYGAAPKEQSLALANWPQFVRVRYETGPVDDVFGNMHRALREEMNAQAKTRPIAVTLSIGGANITFEDIFTAIDTKSLGVEDEVTG